MTSRRRWNWEAALVPCWGEYRQVPFARGLCLLFPFLVAAALRMRRDVYQSDIVIAYLAILAGYTVVYGLAGDWMLQRATRQDATATPPSPSILRGALHALRSLALVVAGFAIIVVAEAFRPHVNQKSNIAAMKADLRNLVTAQEAFFTENGRYASTMDSLLYEPSPSVSVSLLRADSISFAAEASFQRFDTRCRISVNRGEGMPVDSLAGVPVCERSGGR
jgi:Tfp pilus assembly protein PilE